MRFITIRHILTGGTARVPETALAQHALAGWVQVAEEPKPVPIPEPEPEHKPVRRRKPAAERGESPEE